MSYNILIRPGKIPNTRCGSCSAITKNNPLIDGYAACPKCGAEWATLYDDEDPPIRWIGYMFWSLVVIITLIGLLLIRSCFHIH